MPWRHCDSDIFDNSLCPVCGISKAKWTLEWNVTRTFQVTSRKRKLFVRILLLDLKDDPIPGEPYRVHLPEGSTVEGELDEYGTAKVKSDLPGIATVVFPQRARGVIDPIDVIVGEPAPPPAQEELAPPAAAAPLPEQPGGGVVHVVVSGDNLTKIAARYGVSTCDEVYDHPRNAEFRKLRPNRNLIHPGDEVFVPTGPAPVPAAAPMPAKPAPASAPPPPDVEGLAHFLCQAHTKHQHKFRFVRVAGICAWSQPRVRYGGKVRLGFKPTGKAPQAVRFAVYAGDDAKTPLAELAGEARKDHFFALDEARWISPATDDASVLGFRFYALDTSGEPLGGSGELKVLLPRAIHF